MSSSYYSSSSKKKNNHYKSSYQETTEFTEKTQSAPTIKVSEILPEIKEFYISFPNNDQEEDSENETQNEKIKLPKNSIYQIFRMLRIPQSNMSPYIVFTFTYVQSETVTNTITTFKIDYKKVMRLMDYFYIQIPKNDEDIEISKKTLLKIFDMLRLTQNEKLSLMQFFQVEEDVEYDDDEENNEITSYKFKSNKYLKQSETYSSKKTNKNKLKINHIGTNFYAADKMDQSSFNNLINLIHKIPSLVKIGKKNLKNKSGTSKKLIVEGDIKKIKSKNADSTLIKIRTIEKNTFINEKIFGSNKKYKGYKLPPKDEPHSKKTVSLRVKTRPGPPKKRKNVCCYAFIIRKLPEYENATIYLVGSIKQLGNWDIHYAIPMDEEIRNEQHFYTKYMDIKKNDFPFEYKYFYFRNNEPVWIGNNNDKNFIAHTQYFKLYHTIKKSSISVWDLNIRYLNDLDGLNIWDLRKEKFIQAILNSYADVLFFQEITRIQYEYIDEYLNSVYEFVGIYRDNTDKSEKCSISYNIFKYTLSDWGQFWLSSTPYEPGSNDFRNFFPRICTWAALKQINGDDFLFFNVHLDHANFDAHMSCINVVLQESEKIMEKFPNTKFAFLGGCFYCEEDDPVISKIKNYGYNEVLFENTFHDFTGDADHHWDYLFWKERNIGIGKNIIFKNAYVPKEDATINKKLQQYISDHYPVYAEFEQISIEDKDKQKRNRKKVVRKNNDEIINTNGPEIYRGTYINQNNDFYGNQNKDYINDDEDEVDDEDVQEEEEEENYE